MARRDSPDFHVFGEDPEDYDALRESLNRNYETGVVEIKRDVEIIDGIDETIIDLRLKSENVDIPVSNGFLVEVFYSGSDGVLQRAYKSDTVDVINDDVTEEGFERHIKIEVDVEH